jgi:D-alanyl-D-alanine carboxypeptidase
MGSGSIDAARAGARLQQAVERLADRRRLAHAVVGVATLDGSFRWEGAAGTADASGTPMTADHPWFVASVTKLYIATVVLQLHERGMVDLDEPMLTYLGERARGLHRIGGVDHTPSVTVRHLLGHTSGLPDYLEDRPKGGESWYRSISRGEDRAWTLDEAIARARDELTPRFAPRDLSGEKVRARYSDTGFQLLIGVVEAATGSRFEQVLIDQILRPLDLTHTWLPGRSEPIEPVELEPAMLWSKAGPLSLPGVVTSSNDLISTASDTLRFIAALVQGQVFERPDTGAMMQERWNPIFYPMRYGLGMMRYRIGRLFVPGPRAATFVGHSGATGSWLFHCPEFDLVTTGTVDHTSARSTPFRFFPRVLRAIFR